MPRLALLLLFILILVSSCSKEDSPDLSDSVLYFPPVDSDNWETIAPAELSWNASAVDSLYTMLADNGTRAFIILQNGKIAIEKYWGKNILNTGEFNSSSQWYWASAGKSLSAVLVGIAQQEGLMDINDKTSDYLGLGWTSMSKEKEDLITIRHQLTMTTGLDYAVPDTYCTEPECLQYKTDAGEQWYYHNAPYTLLKDVIAAATGYDENTFCYMTLEAATGMDGTWIYDGTNNIYWSKARDMARFGLFILNEGNWDGSQIMTDTNYFTAMTNSSQDINPSYGYLWWLNGKEKVMYPGVPLALKMWLSPDAPADLILAAGKNGQFIGVIPSLNMVVVRMGEAPDDAAVPILFHNEMWKMINRIIGR